MVTLKVLIQSLLHEREMRVLLGAKQAHFFTRGPHSKSKKIIEMNILKLTNKDLL